MINYEHIINRLNTILIQIRMNTEPEVWNDIKGPTREFMEEATNIVQNMSIEPDYIDEGYNKFRSYVRMNEDDKTIVAKIQDVADRYQLKPEVVSRNMQLLAELVLKELPEYVEKENIGSLLKQLRDQVKLNARSVKNNTRRHLMTILHSWYDDHIEDRADAIYNSVSEFINKVHNDIDTLLEGSNPREEIESYMDTYNDDLFYAILDRDPAQGRASLFSLTDEEIVLLIQLRWLSGPFNTRQSINSQLDDLYHDIGFPSDMELTTGIELDDLISNFDSVDVTNRIKKSLRLILEELDK